MHHYTRSAYIYTRYRHYHAKPYMQYARHSAESYTKERLYKLSENGLPVYVLPVKVDSSLLEERLYTSFAVPIFHIQKQYLRIRIFYKHTHTHTYTKINFYLERACMYVV